jgi:3-oxoacyl-[acyl-carrier-protein] synthase-3
MPRVGARIVGTGSYLPARVLTNHDLEKMVDTSDEWIRTRTGIRERHIAEADEPTSVIASKAALPALQMAGVTPEELDLILVATVSPDAPFPNTACYVQKRLGARGAACFSLEAACSGFLYGLEIASNLIRNGNYRTALVMGAERISMYVDWKDRNTCVLFGDGGGAVVLRQVPQEQDALLAARLGADGEFSELLTVPAGGSARPMTHAALDAGLNHIKMAGREVFKLAVNAMVSAAEDVLRQANVTIDQVRWLIPHQANLRIVSAVGERLGVASDRVFVNLDRYGNTSAATIPICLDEIVRAGQIRRDDYVLMVSFGGGLTWAAVLVRW